MADSEKSFIDRAQKSRNLHAAATGFAPAYVTAPQGTTPAAFLAKIVICEGLNGAVEGGADLWSDKVTQRIATAATIKATATQLLAYIESSPSWKMKVPTWPVECAKMA